MSPMVSNSKAARLAREAATPFLAERIERVFAEDTSDSQGEDALRITIVMKSGSVLDLDGDRVLDALVAIQNALSQAGEDRLAIVHYEEAGQEEEPEPTSTRAA